MYAIKVCGKALDGGERSKFHATAALPTRQEPLVMIEQEAGRTRETVCALGRRETPLVPAENRTTIYR
jgi:hypothetical protein